MAQNNNILALAPSGIRVPVPTPYPNSVIPYIENGLLYKTNQTEFVRRDDNGNVLLEQGNTNNQNLVIESVSLFYNNKSVIDNIDTRFKYFKFPIENTTEIDINIDLDDEINDPVFAKYAPSADFDIENAQDAPDINSVLMDNVIGGDPQIIPNSYTINELIKNSGADLRMRIQLEHVFNSQNNNNGGTIFFYLMKIDNNGNVDRTFKQLPDGGLYPDGQVITKNYDVVINNNDLNVGDRFQIGVDAGQEGHTIISLGSFWSITNNDLNVDINNNLIFTVTNNEANVVRNNNIIN